MSAETHAKIAELMRKIENTQSLEEIHRENRKMVIAGMLTGALIGIPLVLLFFWQWNG